MFTFSQVVGNDGFCIPTIGQWLERRFRVLLNIIIITAAPNRNKLSMILFQSTCACFHGGTERSVLRR